MHFKSLKVFCDIVDRRSFSRAADENGMSQSGASQVVHHLEQRLGVKLIDRSKRPFVLTPEGQVYYRGCQKLVQRFASLEEEVRTLHQEVEGRVTVASIYSVGLSHMNQLVQEFLSKYPKANVRLEYQHPDRVYELVESDRVDLGLVSYPKSSRAIKAVIWREEPMVLACAPNHPLAQRRTVSVRDLDGQQLVGFEENLRIRHEIDRALALHRVEVDVVMQFDNIETLKRAVEINAGVSLLPAPTITREVQSGSLVAIALSDIQLIRPLGMILRRGKEPGKSVARFMQLLERDAQSAADAPESELERSGLDGEAAEGRTLRTKRRRRSELTV